MSSSLATLGNWNSTPIEPTSELPCGDDFIGGDSGDIAAGGRDRADDGDHRLLLGEPAQLVVELLGAGRGAAGAVDRHQHGARMSNSPIDLTRSSVALSPVMMPLIERRAIWGESLAAGPGPPSPNRAKAARPRRDRPRWRPECANSRACGEGGDDRSDIHWEATCRGSGSTEKGRDERDTSLFRARRELGPKLRRALRSSKGGAGPLRIEIAKSHKKLQFCRRSEASGSIGKLVSPRLCLRLVAAFALAGAAFSAPAAQAAGWHYYDPECPVALGADKAMKFVAMQPKKNIDRVCDVLPDTGATVIALDAPDAELREMNWDIRVVRDVEGAGEPAESDTVLRLPLQKFRNGMVNFDVNIQTPGKYALYARLLKRRWRERLCRPPPFHRGADRQYRILRLRLLRPAGRWGRRALRLCRAQEAAGRSLTAARRSTPQRPTPSGYRRPTLPLLKGRVELPLTLPPR